MLLLALLSAVTLGAADFSGGMAARRVPPVLVVTWSNAAGLAVALVGLLALGSGTPQPADALWGSAAGLSGAASAVLLYRALARGRMSVVAPTSAAVTAAVPLSVGLVGGDPLSPTAVGAFVLAIGGIVLVSHVRDVGGPRGAARAQVAAIAAAVGAGLGFGLFLVLLAHGSATGLGPLVWARLASLSVLGGLLLRRRAPVRTPLRTLWPAIGCGVLDMTSNVLFVVAVRSGSLSVAGLLASLYPVSTVVLAGLVCREHPGPRQCVGIACALTSVGLFALT
jgi:drug/metabolite transporter (DMT)-like permease